MIKIFKKSSARRKRKHKSASNGEAWGLAAVRDPRSPMAEAYRTIRTNIHYASVDSPIKTILVTSPQPTEGKSTTASNLAAVLAQAGYRTLLVDCDFRRPTVHKIFGMANVRGLTNHLAEETPLAELVENSVVDGLYVLGCGPIPPNPAEMLSSARMQDFLSRVAAEYDRIIIDSPPTMAVTDPLILSSMVDGVILVVKAGETEVQAAREAKEKLLAANARVLGVVINGVKPEQGGYYYYYYYGDDSSD